MNTEQVKRLSENSITSSRVAEWQDGPSSSRLVSEAGEILAEVRRAFDGTWLVDTRKFVSRAAAKDAAS